MPEDSKPLPLPTSGGSYRRLPDGTLELVEKPTENHPDGNDARPAEPTASARAGLKE